MLLRRSFFGRVSAPGCQPSALDGASHAAAPGLPAESVTYSAGDLPSTRASSRRAPGSRAVRRNRASGGRSTVSLRDAGRLWCGNTGRCEAGQIRIDLQQRARLPVRASSLEQSLPASGRSWPRPCDPPRRASAAIVRASWRDPESERVFGDESVFDQLRIDPYYRTTAARHLELKPYFDRLMRDSGARRVSLVHGDCWLVWMASHPQST